VSDYLLNLLAPGWPIQKPAHGADLDTDNRFARGMVLGALLNEGSGESAHDQGPLRQRYRAQGEFAAGQQNNTARQWTGSPWGPALNLSNGSEVVIDRRLTPNTFPDASTSVFSVFIGFRLDSLPAGGNNAALFSVGEKTDSNACIGLGITSAGVLYMGNGDQSTVVAAPAPIPSPSLNDWHVAGLTQFTSARRLFYLDGAAAFDTTAGSAGAIGAANPFVIGHWYTNAVASAATFPGQIAFVYIWTSDLLDADAFDALRREPFLPFQAPEPLWFLRRRTAGGTTFTKTLTATQSQAAQLIRQAQITRKAAQGQAPFLVKRPQATRKATQSQAAVLRKQAQAVRKATQGQVATLLRAVTRVKTLLATQGQSAVLVRQARLIRRAAQSQAGVLRRAVKVTRRATQAQAATLVRQARGTLRATQAQTATVVRSCRAIRTAANAQTARVVRQARLIRAGAQGQTATFQRLRALLKTLTATQSQAAVVSTTRTLHRTLSAAQGQAAILTKRAAVIRRATQGQTASLRRAVSRRLLALQGQAGALVRQARKTIRTTQGQLATFSTLPVLTTVVRLRGAFGAALRAGAALAARLGGARGDANLRGTPPENHLGSAQAGDGLRGKDDP
jgi:hypothetical protein